MLESPNGSKNKTHFFDYPAEASNDPGYIKLTDDKQTPLVEISGPAQKLKVVLVPPFSGIGAEETGLQMGYQNMLVGQGKPGDILRNLLLEVFKNDRKNNTRYWQALTEDIKDLFGYELAEPKYLESTDPFIRVEYRDPLGKTRKPFDIASAGSGFHQVFLTKMDISHDHWVYILISLRSNGLL